eukprot:745897-Hanusia_phi.AAC.3
MGQNGLNGILADEMGLGKTIQVRDTTVQGPFLIVAPLSTIGGKGRWTRKEKQDEVDQEDKEQGEKRAIWTYKYETQHSGQATGATSFIDLPLISPCSYIMAVRMSAR